MGQVSSIRKLLNLNNQDNIYGQTAIAPSLIVKQMDLAKFHTKCLARPYVVLRASRCLDFLNHKICYNLSNSIHEIKLPSETLLPSMTISTTDRIRAESMLIVLVRALSRPLNATLISTHALSTTSTKPCPKLGYASDPIIDFELKFNFTVMQMQTFILSQSTATIKITD